MSEELGYVHAAQTPTEPILPVAEASDAPSVLTQQASPVEARTPSSVGNFVVSPTETGVPRFNATIGDSAGKRKFVPGGGSALASGDKPGDPYASLIVLPADALMGKAPPNAAALQKKGKMPPRLQPRPRPRLPLRLRP